MLFISSSRWINDRVLDKRHYNDEIYSPGEKPQRSIAALKFLEFKKSLDGLHICSNMIT